MDVVRRLNRGENFDLPGQNIQIRTEQYLLTYSQVQPPFSASTPETALVSFLPQKAVQNLFKKSQ